MCVRSRIEEFAMQFHMNRIKMGFNPNSIQSNESTKRQSHSIYFAYANGQQAYTSDANRMTIRYSQCKPYWTQRQQQQPPPPSTISSQCRHHLGLDLELYEISYAYITYCTAKRMLSQ